MKTGQLKNYNSSLQGPTHLVLRVKMAWILKLTIRKMLVVAPSMEAEAVAVAMVVAGEKSKAAVVMTI